MNPYDIISYNIDSLSFINICWQAQYNIIDHCNIWYIIGNCISVKNCFYEMTLFCRLQYYTIVLYSILLYTLYIGKQAYNTINIMFIICFNVYMSILLQNYQPVYPPCLDMCSNRVMNIFRSYNRYCVVLCFARNGVLELFLSLFTTIVVNNLM